MDDTLPRCGWCLGDPLYTAYHDDEWGSPNHDDKRHFEFLILEQAQAGLSWITILKRRENYRKAYDGFDPAAAAEFGPEKIGQLMNDPGIIRNRRKIEASVGAAKVFLEIAKEFGSFDAYIWNFTGGKPVIGHYSDIRDIPASTPLAERVSRDMRSRGVSFFGPVVAYSFLQAVGIVDDHIESCFKRKAVNA